MGGAAKLAEWKDASMAASTVAVLTVAASKVAESKVTPRDR